MSTCKLSTKCSEIIDFSQEIRPTIHRICKIFIFNCNSDKICPKKMKSCGNNIEKQHADHITKIYQTGKKEVSKTKNRQMNGKKCKWDFQCVRARRLYMHSVWYNCHRIFSLMSSWFSSRWIFFCLFLFISWCSQWMTVLFRFFLSFLFSDNFSCIQFVSDIHAALFVSLLFSTHSLLHKAHFFHIKTIQSIVDTGQSTQLLTWFFRKKNEIFLLRI